MIFNLIDNGIRHNVPGGRLEVTTGVRGRDVVLEVVNGGDPIDPEQAKTLAEPFRRLDRTADGFGLGLSIVRSVAEAHGGTMALTAPPGGGLRVVVKLPAKAPRRFAEPVAERVGGRPALTES
jgi:signal transduction histidine kinase